MELEARESRDEEEVGEDDDEARRPSAAKAEGKCYAPWSGRLWLGRAQAEALLQHARFHLRFASAVLLLVQHVHVWALKGFRAFQGADGIDMVRACVHGYLCACA